MSTWQLSPYDHFEGFSMSHIQNNILGLLTQTELELFSSLFLVLKGVRIDQVLPIVRDSN